MIKVWISGFHVAVAEIHALLDEGLKHGVAAVLDGDPAVLRCGAAGRLQLRL